MTPDLVAIAAHGLAGARVTAFDDAPLSDLAWQTLVERTSTHGLSGLLADAVDRRRLPTTTDQHAEVTSARLRILSGCLALESVLLAALDRLASEGVEPLVVHGIPAANLDYADPAWRPFGDVDLLVRPTELATALASLGAAGFHPIAPGRHDRLADDMGRQIEIHSHVAPTRWARQVSVSELWRHSTELRLAGRPVLVLADSPRLIMSCLRTVATGQPRLIAVRDVVQQVLAHPEPAEVLDLAERWHATGGTTAAIDEAWNRFDIADVVALSVWAARNRPEPQLVRSRPRRAVGGRRWPARR